MLLECLRSFSSFNRLNTLVSGTFKADANDLMDCRRDKGIRLAASALSSIFFRPQRPFLSGDKTATITFPAAKEF